ncbi:DUF192 domain-containing protein [Segnochrobactraceae bacterium EtOH-i3]
MGALSGIGRAGRGLVLAAALVLATAGAGQADGPGKVSIRSGGTEHSFTVEVVDTPASREHGLMGRTALAPDHGMLFDFQVTEPVYFWMKNTPLPLDMIFIGRDLAIVRIEHSATPFSERVIPSGGPARYVLEVAGGTAKRLGLSPGDHVALDIAP